MITIQYETKFDKEYSTQWNREMMFLASKGIRYVFAKEVNGLSTWKYTKNKRLFEALAEFYN